MTGVKIIDRFGGVRALAQLLGMPQTTVQHWRDTGLIPAKHQQRVLDLGRDLLPPLCANDFFAAREEQAA